MKKIIAYFLTGMLSLGFFSCGDDDKVGVRNEFQYHVTFDVSSASVGEDSPEPLAISYHFRGVAGDTPITVEFTLGGTAVEGVDYNVIGGTTGTIPANEYYGSIVIEPINNDLQNDPRTIEISIASVSGGYGAGSGGLGATVEVAINDDDCSPDITGVYTVVTEGCYGDGSGGCDEDYTAITNTVVVEKTSAGYSFTDLTGGLYKNGYGDDDNSGTVVDNCGELSINDQPDTVYGGDVFNGSGSIDVDENGNFLGTFTIIWANGYGDSGTSTYTLQ